MNKKLNMNSKFGNAGGKGKPLSKKEIELAKGITGDTVNLIKEEGFMVKPKPMKIKKEMKNTTLSIDGDVLEDIKLQVKRANDTNNNVINEFIKQFYDVDLGKFTIEVDSLKKGDIIPVKIPKEAMEALQSGAKERNMKVGEYFSAMYRKVIK